MSLQSLLRSKCILKTVGIALHDQSLPHLILPADIGRVLHVVTPVLLLDLVLLVSQEGQLFGAALHVLMQAVQVVVTPF